MKNFLPLYLALCLAVPIFQSSVAVAASEAIAPAKSREQIDLGLAAYKRGDYHQAVKHWQQYQNLVAIKRRNSDQTIDSIELEGLSYLALGYHKLSHPQAQATIAQAKRLMASSPDLLKAKILNISGTIALGSGEYTTANNDWQQASRLYAATNDLVGHIGSEINRAIALQRLGKYRQSHDLLSRQNEKIDKLAQPNLKFQSLYNLSIAYAKMGDYSQAQTTVIKAQAHAKNPEQKAASLIVLGNLATVDNPQQAIKNYQQAAEETNLTETKITAQLNQLRPLLELHQNDQAQELAALTKSQIEQLPEAHQRDELRLNLFTTSLETKLNSIEVADIQQLERIARESTSNRIRSYAYGTLGQYHAQTKETDKAINNSRNALEISQKIDAKDLSYRWQWQLGKLIKDSDHRAAVAYYQAAVANLDQVRGDLISYSAKSQYNYKVRIEPVYREYVKLVLHNPTQDNLQKARQTIESLQMAELENYFRSACLQAEPQHIDSIELAATIYPIVLEKRLAVITAIGDRLEYQSFEINEGEVAKTVKEYIENFSPAKSRRRREELGAKLYGWLVESNQHKLKAQNIETLVFVLDDEFRNLPVSALNHGGKYLIENYEIALTPGLQLLPSRQISEVKLEAVVGGLSEARQGFDPLPGVEAEVTQIAANIKSNLLLNQKFTNQDLQNALTKTRQPVLHLATHGQFSSKPEDTYILTWEDRLNVSELESLLKVREETPKLIPIELLVLSACQTATGDTQAALGLAGVALRSGARSTIATLWSVNDASTEMLIGQVYDNLKQSKSKGETLRQAQLKLIKSEKYSHPFFWSPFVLVGNWN